MNTFKKALITIAILSPLTAAASVADDIARIRQLLPPGQDVAQLQEQLLRGASEADALDQAKANYVIRDLNGDGNLDVLVIAEENPQIVNDKLNNPCESIHESNCSIVYGKRSLLFFLGQKDGSVKLQFTNNKMIRAADEGGVFGDPLEGFAVKKNGAVTYSVYGGSAWRWAYTDTLQFRNGQLYIIGLDTYQSTPTMLQTTVSTNYLTGEVIETRQKGDDGSPTHVKKYRVKVNPLVKVADFAGDID